jgi:hypothetical protein
MNSLTMSLLIVLLLNGLMILSQAAITAYNPDSQFYTGQVGIIEHENVSLKDNPRDELPTSGGAVQMDDGTYYTDTPGTLLGWLGTLPGFSTVIQIVKAPYTFMSLFNLPGALTVIFGTIWWIITLYLIIMVLFGREI